MRSTERGLSRRGANRGLGKARESSFFLKFFFFLFNGWQYELHFNGATLPFEDTCEVDMVYTCSGCILHFDIE